MTNSGLQQITISISMKGKTLLIETLELTDRLHSSKTESGSLDEIMGVGVISLAT
jgi:hypothetical protein